MATPPRTSFTPSTTPEQAEFVSLTQRPAVTFDLSHAQPPSPLYVGLDDRLVIFHRGQISGGTITVRGRMLRPDGTVMMFSRNFTTNGSFALTQAIFDEMEGFLLGLTVFETGLNITRGQLYVQVMLARGPLANLEPTDVLIADYVGQQFPIGWPNSRNINAVDGIGHPRTIVGTNPAAGVEISEAIVAGSRARLRGITFTLVTSVAVANREVELILDDGANIFARIPAGLNQVAGSTTIYSYAAHGQRIAGLQSPTLALPLPDLWLHDGSRIRTITTNLQGADDYGAPVYQIEQLVDNTS